MHRALPLLVLAACFSPPAEQLPKPDDTARVLEGELCAAPVAERPVKVLIALDASQSLKVTDPNGSRAAALTALFDALPQGVDVSIAVVAFTGSTSGWLLAPHLPQFHRLDDVTAAERTALPQRLLGFTPPNPNESTDFVKPLGDIYSVISRDIGEARSARAVPALYSILFVSDGSPTNNQDDELLCGDAITRMRALGAFTADVRLSTAFVFSPTVVASPCGQPPVGGAVCRLPVFPPGTCASEVIATNLARLERMAELGSGKFSAFVANTPVDFGFFAQGLKSTFTLGTVVASNLSAAPSTGEADSDQDALPDSLEEMLGTDPLRRDSDGDGFSDGVERWAEAGREADPSRLARVALGCAAMGADSDCDALPDCDEDVLGSSASTADSDDDGLPDGVEWQHGTDPGLRDHTIDPDLDGAQNGDEVRRHTDPSARDASRPAGAYRYLLTKTRVNTNGAQCWSVRVENLTIPATRSGESALYLSAVLTSDDEPTRRPIVQALSLKATRGMALAGFTPGDFSVGCR